MQGNPRQINYVKGALYVLFLVKQPSFSKTYHKLPFLRSDNRNTQAQCLLQKPRQYLGKPFRKRGPFPRSFGIFKKKFLFVKKDCIWQCNALPKPERLSPCSFEEFKDKPICLLQKQRQLLGSPFIKWGPFQE